MKRLHLALSSHDIEASVADYSARFGQPPCVHVRGEYALWRTAAVNLSVRHDPACSPGSLRHLGFEDPQAAAFSVSEDVNGIAWERFTAAQQAEEIEQAWPGTNYRPD